MPIGPDLIVFSKDNEPSLLVEVKNKKGASKGWAREFRNNLLRHGGFPRAPYFLLVTPDKLFLWGEDSVSPDAFPTAEVSTRDTLKVLLDRLPSEELDQLSLELVTHAWLSTIADATGLRDEIAEYHGWVIDTGLFDSIEGGHVELEPVA